jgi:hypothetical protein
MVYFASALVARPNVRSSAVRNFVIGSLPVLVR